MLISQPTIADALQNLCPGAKWVLYNNSYDEVNWMDDKVPIPTREAVTKKLQDLHTAYPYDLLRAERNIRLAACDWVSLRAVSTNQRVPEEWASYMQALRDLPGSSTPTLNEFGQLNITSIAWPPLP